MWPTHPIVHTWRQYYHGKLVNDDDRYMLIDRVIRCSDDLEAKTIVSQGQRMDLVSYFMKKHWWRLLYRVMTLRPNLFVDKEDYYTMARRFNAPIWILQALHVNKPRQLQQLRQPRQLLRPPQPPQPSQESPRRMCTRSVTQHNKRPHAMTLRPRK